MNIIAAAPNPTRAFLLRYAYRAVGQLTDALLDPDGDIAVRRRIPHILAYTTSQRAVDGLTAVLGDAHFEVRFNASRALEFLHRMSDDLQFDRTALFQAVERELSVPKTMRHSRKLLDSHDQDDCQYWYLDDVLQDRADKSLEHVFSLLAIQLPIDPLKVAFRGLHSQDRMLHALALEFLESHLSAEMVLQLRRLAPNISARPKQSQHQLSSNEV